MFRFLRRQPDTLPDPTDSIVPDIPATLDAIKQAYRLVLGRDVDPGGLAHYQTRLSDGSFGIRRLLEELFASEEYQQRAARATDAPTEPMAAPNELPAPGLIRPADVIAKYSLAELNATAEEYYRRIPDPLPLLAKPFSYWHESPQMLHDLGLLLAGLHLGKTMSVLDFGAGTGWLTRILTQLQCHVYATDVSPSALALGARLFEVLPPIGTVPYQPVFLPFDGRRIALPDASVDRIICFDAFHHVPNPDDVLKEFARVLKPGGLAGFSEPGRHHSRSAQSQYEMKNHAVLENDIDVDAISATALAAGFTNVTVRAIGDLEMSHAEYQAMFDPGSAAHDAVRERVWAHTTGTTFNRTVFFLHKGPRALDSRGHEGLAHVMRVANPKIAARAGVKIDVPVEIINSGTARWLHENTQIFGIVRLGAHLFDAQQQLVNLDYHRQPLPHPVEPGQQLTVSATLPPLPPGQHVVVLDLVAEGVTWFENVGSTPVSLAVSVSD